MGGDEVLKYVETFAKVCGDRIFDNRAIRLRHQATHTGQLPDLCRRTPRTGIRHNEYRVERFLLHFVALGIDHGYLTNFIHHRARDLIVGARPDIDNLVIAFTGGNQTRGPLLFNVLDLGFRAANQFGFRVGDNHVINADRNSRFSRVMKACIHQLISKNNRFFQPNFAVTGIDQYRYVFLIQGFIDQVEGETFRQQVTQNCSTDSGIDKTTGFNLVFLLIDFIFDHAAFYLRLQLHSPGMVGTRRFFRISKHHALSLHINFFPRHVVETENNILGRYDDRFAISGRQDVIGRHHQGANFELRLDR